MEEELGYKLPAAYIWLMKPVSYTHLEIAPAWLEHLNQLIDRLDSEQEARQMYIKKYWGNFIGGSLSLIHI